MDLSSEVEEIQSIQTRPTEVREARKNLKHQIINLKDNSQQLLLGKVYLSQMAKQ